jgi:hypothetical protein
MRRSAERRKLAAMDEQRLVLDAALDRGVICGTLTVATGERRAFHGWLELNAALEAMLQTSCVRQSQDLPKPEAERR